MNHPIPGKDAQWLACCVTCDDMTLHASRGGFHDRGIDHCYTCGLEKRIGGIRQEDVDRMITSCRFHWQKYPLIPYTWHLLSENERWIILGMKGNVVQSH
jgi:hypothetical protein